MADREKGEVDKQITDRIVNRIAETDRAHEGTDAEIESYLSGALAGAKLALVALRETGIEFPEKRAIIESIDRVVDSQEHGEDLMQRLNPGLRKGEIGFGDA